MFLRPNIAVTVALLALALTGCPLLTVGEEQPRNIPHGSCSIDGWCWANGQPKGNQVNAIWTSGPDEAVIVGGGASDNGMALRWDGKTLADFGAPNLPGLTGVWADGPANIWCSAIDGTVEHFDGTTWSAIEIANSTPWNGIAGSGPSDLWLVGNGEFAHYDGTRWSVIPEQGYFFDSISSSGPYDVWAVGFTEVPTTADGGFRAVPAALHFDGMQWNPVSVPSVNFEGDWLVGVSAGDSMAWYFSFLGGAERWNGQYTEFVDTRAGGLVEAVWSPPDGGAWILTPALDNQSVPAMALSVYDAGGFSPIASIEASATYAEARAPAPNFWSTTLYRFAITGSSDSNIWFAANASAISHWDGAQLKSVGASLSDETLTGISGTGSDDVWVVGGKSLLHFDGTTWSKGTDSRLVGLVDVFAAEKGAAWAVSYGSVFRGDQGVWTPALTAPVDATFAAIHGSAANDVWVVGDRGTAAHFDGTGWTSAPAPLPADLHDVFSLARNDAWAVGTLNQKGLAFHHDGRSWTPFDFDFGPGSLEHVWASGSHDVWVTGGGKLWHFDGRQWQPITGLPLEQLSFSPLVGAVWGNGPDDVWVGGQIEAKGGGPWGSAGEAMFHFDGRTWTQETFGADYSVIGVFTTGSTTWTIGPAGAILVRQPR